MAVLSGMYLVSAGSSFAIDYTWTGATSTQFNLTTNWATSVAPTVNDRGIFTGTVTARQPSLTNATRQIAGLVFSTGTGGWTLSAATASNTFFVGTGGISTAGQTSGTNTISANVLLGVNATNVAAQTWEVGTGGTLVVSGSTSEGGAASVLTIGTSGNQGTLVLNGNSTRTASTNWAFGSVVIGADNTLGSGTLTVSSAGTLSSAGTHSLANSIAATSSVQIGGNGALTLSGTVSGSGGITHSGSGTTTLSGNNTYTGTTAINAGTLLVNGNQTAASGAVVVAANAVLAGNGTIGGNVVISGTGTLAPGVVGNSTSTLTLANKNLTLNNSDSKVALDVVGTSAGSFDRVVGINSFSLDGDVTITLTGSYTSGDSWDFFDFTSKTGNFDSFTLVGSYVGALTRVGDIWSNGNIGGNSWQFDQTTGVLSVVPEPRAWALFALGAVIVLWRGKSRRMSS